MCVPFFTILRTDQQKATDIYDWKKSVKYAFFRGEKEAPCVTALQTQKCLVIMGEICGGHSR